MGESERLVKVSLLLFILVLGLTFRVVGIDWGEGQAIHPDEEFLRQVTSAVALPDSVGLYFDTANSTLNPYNRGYGFFVYGTLPLFVTRAVGEALDAGLEAPVSLPARLMAPLMVGRPAEEAWAGAFTGSRVVGRMLAAIFDVGSILFVYLIGRRLHSDWVGLLAAFFYACAFLAIQQSHFYTVDAFAGFFAAAAIYFSIRAAQTGAWGAFALAGLAVGLGVACKISLWPLGLIVALAGLLWLAARPVSNTSYLRGAGRVALAGALALIAFRIAQPYTFVGPGFFNVGLNDQWLGNMAEIRGQMSGTVDVYHGHQWANRTPLIFPWVNMVFWGLGLPLGLAAWAGWGAAAVQLVRRRSEIHRFAPLLLTWAWGTVFFFYQGVQWVKSIRYFIPIYSVFTVLAAWAVARLVEWAWGAQQRRLRHWLALGLAGLVFLGALGWAASGTSIYTRSHTRIAASRWIFENVPTAATVYLRTAAGDDQIQVTIPAGVVFTDDVPLGFPFTVDVDAELVGVALNHVSDPEADREPEQLRVAVASDPSGQRVLAEATREIDPPAELSGVAALYPLDAPVRLIPGSSYYLVVEVVEGGTIQLYTSVLATEHWDWAPPLRIDGHDPFGGMYRGLTTSSEGTLQLYHPDTLEKRENLLNWLDEADVIITGSNRLYASIPRLASRYPLTMAYYEALFNGELGFELVADFVSPMALGPFEFPDQEEPFPVPEATYQYRPGSISVPMPTAEEAFSVYDHPRVLIFRKTAAYSRAQAAALLPAALVDQVVWVTTQDVTPSLGDLFGGGGGADEGEGPRDALLDTAAWAEQRAGGTWSEMFDRDGWLNRFQWLGAAAWYLAAAALGWLAFPLLFVALPRLRDRGYGFARPVGLLVVAYLTWLAASLHVLPNTRSTIALMVGLLAALGGAVAWRRWGALTAFVRENRRMLLIEEGLFLLLFVAWTLVRVQNPDLWHPVVGGEKPMDFAYLTAVIKSTWFPPYDPWLSGGYLNYYYFGFVLVSTLTKLTGILPSIAYNLALALFFAIVGSAAFSVAFNLTGEGDGDGWLDRYRPYVAGGLAVLFMLLLGNLGELRVIYNGLRMLSIEPPFESTIPGLPAFVQALQGLRQVLFEGAQLPFRPETPYWEPTRMVPFPAFTEFPAFTFLYGDPHAHMLALPYTLVMLGLALNWARGGYRLREGWLFSCLLGSLALGMLWATNTWDFPTYLLVGVAGLVLGMGLAWRDLPALAWRAALLVGLAFLLFQPYTQTYVPAVSGVETWQPGWEESRIPLDIFLLLKGQFLVPLTALMAATGWRLLKPVQGEERGLLFGVALTLGGALIVGLAVRELGIPLAVVAVPVGAAAAMAMVGDATVERRFVWGLLLLSMGICLGVELISVGADRMNTVFKFYYQAWTCLAIAAAAALAWLTDAVRKLPEEWQDAWWVAAMGLILAMALFPALSIPAKLGDRFTDATGPTLDGMAYMKLTPVYYDPVGEVDIAADYDAIVWLQDHVPGSPVILEGLGISEYRWGNRVSIYTGLPTVIGWRWHQVQQRMAGNTFIVEQRRIDVTECFSTADMARAWEILTQYEVEYVYVGPYERLYYPADGLAKFDTMVTQGLLRLVYDVSGVRIYEVMP
ncbi:MAG: glycosyltransferase family 39 protein [Anaerolineae bacterium]|nr:glycosyltransferase family 39 protein [Anaerolineae bacterium]